MAECKHCKSKIEWHLGVCYDFGTLIYHYDSCEEKYMKLVMATGVYFENEFEKGYYTDLAPSGIQYVEITSPPIIGENYKPTNYCKQGCAPWEDCGHP